MTLGAMQDWTMRLTHLLDHAAREHATREIVSRLADGSEARTDWAGIRRDALKLTQALRALGIARGDRIATLAMNHSRHLVSWFGAIGAGGVLHTINPRLFDDQLEYIGNHAEDRVLLYDAVFAPLVERMKPRWTSIEHYVCFDPPAATTGSSPSHEAGFDAWIGAHDGDTAWTDGDEREPCMLCYTSGTTGNPKGVLYEHRSTMLHAISALQPSAFALDAPAVMLPIVPMFHAASWGLPWAGAAVGAKFVYAATNEPEVLCGLMRREKVTHSAGVPTVWLAMLEHLDATGQTLDDLPRLKQVIVGGSAAPRAIIARLMRAGIRVAHAWGMTETSPIGTMGAPTYDWDELRFEQKVDIVALQGQTLFGVELRTVDENGGVLPRDGTTSGALHVRGPWVVQRYFKGDHVATDKDQWFDTGDVATLRPDGILRLTDRAKDVIKSGGEWISSVELENAALGCEGVAEAAAIGIHHPKWDERPLLAVVRKPGSSVTGEAIREFLAGKVARWWLPDAIEFVDAIPHTGTGKISKKDLRERFRDYRLTG